MKKKKKFGSFHSSSLPATSWSLLSSEMQSDKKKTSNCVCTPIIFFERSLLFPHHTVSETVCLLYTLLGVGGGGLIFLLYVNFSSGFPPSVDPVISFDTLKSIVSLFTIGRFYFFSGKNSMFPIPTLHFTKCLPLFQNGGLTRKRSIPSSALLPPPPPPPKRFFWLPLNEAIYFRGTFSNDDGDCTDNVTI